MLDPIHDLSHSIVYKFKVKIGVYKHYLDVKFIAQSKNVYVGTLDVYADRIYVYMVFLICPQKISHTRFCGLIILR